VNETRNEKSGLPMQAEFELEARMSAWPSLVTQSFLIMVFFRKLEMLF
jgi:hypothetical protein